MGLGAMNVLDQLQLQSLISIWPLTCLSFPPCCPLSPCGQRSLHEPAEATVCGAKVTDDCKEGCPPSRASRNTAAPSCTTLPIENRIGQTANVNARVILPVTCSRCGPAELFGNQLEPTKLTGQCIRQQRLCQVQM